MLKPLKVSIPKESKSKPAHPVVAVPSANVQNYNQAVSDKKDAEAQLKELKPVLVPFAEEHVLTHNCQNPTDLLSSVVLQDATGATLLATIKNSYPALDPALLEAKFETLKTVDGKKADVNEFAVRTVKVKFNSDVFLNGAGSFNLKLYSKLTEAVQAACEQFNVENPLSMAEVCIVKPDFHEKRFVRFSAEQQSEISEIAPAEVAFKPLAQ